MDEDKTTAPVIEESDAPADQPSPAEPQDQPEEPKAPKEVEQSGNQGDNESETSPSETDNQEQETGTEKKETRKERRQARYIKSLSKKLEDARTQGFQEDFDKGRSPGYKPIQYGEREYQIDDLQKDRDQYGQGQYERGLESAQSVAQTTVWLDSVERDNDYVDREYPVLNENSDDYDPDTANYINNLYLQTVGYDGKSVKNPIKYREFVSAYMEGAERIAEARNAETAQNIARQSGRTSVKSTQGNRRQSRDWSKPGAIASLSSDEYDKFKPEIDTWMKQNVNPNIRG